MKNQWSVLLSLLTIALSVRTSCCGVLSVTPNTDQYLPINSQLNVTFSCNVSVNEVNSMERQAIWEVEERQIQSGQNSVRTAFERIGIFIEEVSLGAVDLIVTSQARMQYQDTGLMVRCTAFTPDEPPITDLGPALFVVTFGNPEVPANLRLITSYLNWDRPANIPEEVEVNYTVIINSSTSQLGNVYHLSDQIQLSIEFLELALADAEQCEVFMFHVVASVADAGDSAPAIATDTVTFSRNVSSIDESLRVNYLTFIDDGDVMADISFSAMEICSNFPNKNYTLIVNSSRGPTALAMSSVTTIILTTSDLPFFVRDQIYQVGVEVCNDVICLRSTTIPLSTSDVQSASVILFDTNVFLNCSFANGSPAVGCMFIFRANSLNGTENEEFFVLRSMGGQLCNVTDNQLSGYTNIVVFDLESDGVSVTPVPIIVDIIPVGSEDVYTEMTGCTVQQEVVQVTDGRAVSIAVPIVIVVLLVSVVVVSVIVLVCYLRLEKKKKPKLEESASSDTLTLDIASDNQRLLHTPPIFYPSSSQSLPMTSKSGIALSHDPEASLPALQSQRPAPFFSVPAERAPPIELELHRNTIKLKINKSSLRAMARFAKQSIQPDGSLPLDEGQSLLSRVHITDDFKSLCRDLPPLEEGGEEEEELKSWGIINAPLEQKSAL